MNSSPKLYLLVVAIALLGVLACPASAQIFTSSQTITVGSGPRGIAIDDLDGDGYPDIVVANSGGSSVSVLINKGHHNGNFFPKVDYPLGTNQGPTSVAIANISSATKKDIVVCDYLAGKIALLKGNGNGTFQPAMLFSVGPGTTSPQSLTVADLDNNGSAYVIVTVLANNTVRLFRWNGTALVTTASASYPVGRLPWAVTTANLNHDHIPDIITANTYGGNVSVLLSTGPHTYAPAVNYTMVGGGPDSVDTGDLDGDGNPDIIAPDAFSSNLVVFNGNGDGTFDAAVRTPDAGSGISVVAAKLQGLSVPDVIIADFYNNQIDVRLNNGGGTLTPDSGSPYATGSGPAFVAIGNLKKNGEKDVVVSNLNSNTITIWYQ